MVSCLQLSTLTGLSLIHMVIFPTWTVFQRNHGDVAVNVYLGWFVFDSYVNISTAASLLNKAWWCCCNAPQGMLCLWFTWWYFVNICFWKRLYWYGCKYLTWLVSLGFTWWYIKSSQFFNISWYAAIDFYHMWFVLDVYGDISTLPSSMKKSWWCGCKCLPHMVSLWLT